MIYCILSLIFFVIRGDTDQCLTYSPHINIPYHYNNSFSSTCEEIAGHWPTEFCYWCNSTALSLEIVESELQIFSHTPTLPSHLLNSWNIIPEIDQTPFCEYFLTDVLFLPFPYDPLGFQSDGSNYYVIHVDILLPLWNYFRNKSPPSQQHVILFPFNSKLIREMNPQNLLQAFRSSKKYWIHSIQLLASNFHQLIFSHALGMKQFLARSRANSNSYPFPFPSSSHTNIGRTCLQNVQIGLPRYDRPSPISLRLFSQQFREAALFPSPLFPNLTSSKISSLDQEISRHICNTNNISIGLIIREGRRRIANEEEFISIIQKVALNWCQNQSFHSSSSGSNNNNNSCQINVIKIFFGRNSGSSGSNIEPDLNQIQLLSVLIGLQGSGLINGLYLSSFTSVVVYYLNPGWPISSGDPLEYLAARGPYIRHINLDSKKVICSLADDEYCDSGDLIIDEETYGITIIDALNRHQQQCDTKLSQK